MRAMSRVLSLVGLLLLPGMLVAAASETVPLKKGERIVFLGDSITAGGVSPKGYVTLVKNTLGEKHKDLGIEIIGAGISGNKVPDLQKRLDKDVLSKKPTLVVIYIGINDVWHGENNPKNGTPKARFEDGLKEIIGKIKDAGANVLLCTPSVIGEKNDVSNELDALLDDNSDISRKVAEEMKVPLCDYFAACLERRTHIKSGCAEIVTGHGRLTLSRTNNLLLCGWARQRRLWVSGPVPGAGAPGPGVALDGFSRPCRVIAEFREPLRGLRFEAQSRNTVAVEGEAFHESRARCIALFCLGVADLGRRRPRRMGASWAAGGRAM